MSELFLVFSLVSFLPFTILLLMIFKMKNNRKFGLITEKLKSIKLNYCTKTLSVKIESKAKL